MQIESSTRLSYRLMDENDADLLFELDQDPQVMKFINGGQASTRDDINNVLIPRMKAYYHKEKGWGIWKISLTSSGEYLGWILVRPMYFFFENPEFDNLELGWRFFQSAWGKGYASEAAQHIQDHLLTTKQYHYFSAIADEDNVASISIMKKLGMTFKKSYFHQDPLFQTQVVYYQIRALKT